MFAAGGYFFATVLLPGVALGVELATGACAELLGNPVPTFVHTILLSLIPLCALAVMFGLHRGRPEYARRLWLLNGLASGTTMFYCLLFAPLAPIGVIGMVVLLGFLVLSPWFALAGTWGLHKHLQASVTGSEPLSTRSWRLAFWAAFGLLFLLWLPVPVTGHLVREGVWGSSESATRAVRWLRLAGHMGFLRAECDDNERPQGSWFALLLSGRVVSPGEARQVYYRVMGESYVATAPKRRAGRWDGALGGDQVGEITPGLSLAHSRLDATANANEGWGYTEWTLEFKNIDPSDREARAQVALPPGGVVSRLTLWVNGEEREAAFGSRAQTRAAYQSVAVVQRRDPVLVTTCGPDRVLMQCFPVPRDGGVMKVRLGITAPLALASTREARMRWPSFLESNFPVPADFKHLAIAKATRPLAAANRSWQTLSAAGTEHAIRRELTPAELAASDATLRLDRDPGQVVTHTAVADDSPDARVEQKLLAVDTPTPGRVAVVMDTSAAMKPAIRAVAEWLEKWPAGIERRVFVAREGVEEIAYDTPREAARTLKSLKAAGGQDNSAALTRAWEWAAQQTGSAVVWVHGPQPALVHGLGDLQQRLEWNSPGEAPVVYDFQTRTGPNKILGQLDHHLEIQRPDNEGDLAAELARLRGRWWGQSAELKFKRELVAAPRSGDGPAPLTASRHPLRLWAAEECLRLIRARSVDEAVRLAVKHQLVTPVTGAVVLEEASQYEAAKLTPVDVKTVPSVPEPGTLALLALGALLLAARKLKRHVTV